MRAYPRLPTSLLDTSEERNSCPYTPNPLLASTFNSELSTRTQLGPKALRQKNERPVGGPAARAWGMEGLQPEASPVLPTVPLRSRAAERDTGAIRPKPSRSGSRNQLPITVTILLPTVFLVDSPTGSFFTVLPDVSPTLVLVPPYLCGFTRSICFSDASS